LQPAPRLRDARPAHTAALIISALDRIRQQTLSASNSGRPLLAFALIDHHGVRCVLDNIANVFAQFADSLSIKKLNLIAVKMNASIRRSVTVGFSAKRINNR
jgi:hypothetical protein